ncbi:MAG: hypothetical protein M3290_09620, partial [Actinomycetota bacterium]|nr:hypothetical protein [Actinomycetota bacterium]
RDVVAPMHGAEFGSERLLHDRSCCPGSVWQLAQLQRGSVDRRTRAFRDRRYPRYISFSQRIRDGSDEPDANSDSDADRIADNKFTAVALTESSAE